jgi:hypothetical protein
MDVALVVAHPDTGADLAGSSWITRQSDIAVIAPAPAVAGQQQVRPAVDAAQPQLGRSFVCSNKLISIVLELRRGASSYLQSLRRRRQWWPTLVTCG